MDWKGEEGGIMAVFLSTFVDILRHAHPVPNNGDHVFRGFANLAAKQPGLLILYPPRR